jgi:hypothetical protein
VITTDHGATKSVEVAATLGTLAKFGVVAASFVVAGCASVEERWITATCPEVPNPVLFGPVRGINGRGPPGGDATHPIAGVPWPSESMDFTNTSDSAWLSSTTETVVGGYWDFGSAILMALTPRYDWEEGYRTSDVVVVEGLRANIAHVSEGNGVHVYDAMVLRPRGTATYHHLVPPKGQ